MLLLSSPLAFIFSYDTMGCILKPHSTGLTAVSDSCNQILVRLAANSSICEILADCSKNRIGAVQAPLKIPLQEIAAGKHHDSSSERVNVYYGQHQWTWNLRQGRSHLFFA